MGDIKDIDLTGEIAKKSGAPLGDAHELFVRAVLMRLGFEVGKVDLSSGPYDLIVAAYTKQSGSKIFLRVQIKTISGSSLALGGGGRAGVDRTYKSGVKTYKYSEVHNELILGVDKSTFDIYVFPTVFAKKYGSSVGKGKIQVCKNNWNILMNWNQEYLKKLGSQLVT